MSDPDNSSTLNISQSTVSGNCDLKCAYNFKYPNTNLTATNRGVMIALACDLQNVPPVTYNDEKYNLDVIYILSPSVHLYNGSQSPGEIALIHNSVNLGSSLIVYIPLYESTNSNTATDLITEIITNVAASAPSDGETTNINLSNFTPQDIVPNSSFYSYSMSENNNAVVNNIVFGINNGIPLTESTLSTLSSLISPFPQQIPVENLYYNKAGPNITGNLGEGIYISCNPTGSSDSTTNVEVTNTTTNDIANILNNPLFVQVFLGCITFIIIFFVVSMLFNLMSGQKMEMPSYLKPTKSSTTSTT